MAGIANGWLLRGEAGVQFQRGDPFTPLVIVNHPVWAVGLLRPRHG